MGRQFLLILRLTLLAICFPELANSAEISTTKGDIYIFGAIESGDVARFRAVATEEIKRHPETPLERVRIYSPGGDLRAALKLGEQINILQLDTWAPTVSRSGSERTCTIGNKVLNFDPATSEGDARCTCASACFFIWAAGATREGDVLGVHRPAFEAKQFANMPPDKAKQEYEAVLSTSRSYLQKWGIPASMVDEVFEVSSSDVRFLSPSVLKGLRRTAQFDEQIIARCGSVLTTDQFARTAAALMTNKYALEHSKNSWPPRWSQQEQDLRVRQFSDRVHCQQKATKDIRKQTNAIYAAMASEESNKLSNAANDEADLKLEASAVLTNVLKSAKVQNATLINAVNQADVLSDFDATWSDGQILGWLRIVGQQYGSSKKEVMEWALTGEKSGCDGTFTQTILEESDAIFRFSAFCMSANDGTQDHFILITRPRRGGFYLFATLSGERSSFAAATQVDDRLAETIARIDLMNPK